MQPKTSIVNEWAATYNIKCSCNRGNIQVFFCNSDTCKDKEQRFFCADCVLFARKHDHDRVQIKDELETRTKEWKALIESIDSLKQILDNNYYQYEHLIKYLDNENLLKNDLTVKNPAHNLDIDV